MVSQMSGSRSQIDCEQTRLSLDSNLNGKIPAVKHVKTSCQAKFEEKRLEHLALKVHSVASTRGDIHLQICAAVEGLPNTLIRGLSNLKRVRVAFFVPLFE
jgi:hypothetical protein